MTENCQDLKQRYSFADYLYWSLMAAVPLLTAATAIAAVSLLWLGVYLLVLLAGLLTLCRFFCSHCPHYGRSGKTVKCLFLWGLPKFFEPRRGPLGWRAKGLSLLAAVAMVLFPLYWLLDQPGQLLVYAVALTAVGMTLRRHECSRCIYFDCPANRVPVERRTGTGA
jgi:hypothetical protein